MPARGHDVLVVGAGVFGLWTAWHLHRAGRRVAIIDMAAPAHASGSSAGLSRVFRRGYGAATWYTEWAGESLEQWLALAVRTRSTLFHPTGVLWLHRGNDDYVTRTTSAFDNSGIAYSHLTARNLRDRWPPFAVDDSDEGFFEADGGSLSARVALQALASELDAAGIPLLKGRVNAVSRGQGGTLQNVSTQCGQTLRAQQFVLACGPWLDQVCPDVMDGRLFVTRQEVFHFTADAALARSLPVWAEFPYYGLPDPDGRGVKVAEHTHGEPMDPDRADRHASAAGEAQVRQYLARRMPALAASPLRKAQVCQYENSASGDFVIDRHPALDNVWLAGCGSGHGFKHAPAIGAHVTALTLGSAEPLPQFSIASLGTRPDRRVE